MRAGPPLLTTKFESMRINSDPVQYGPAGCNNALTDEKGSEQHQSSARGADELAQGPARLEPGENKFAVFEPDSLVVKAHSDAVRDDPVGKLNAAKRL